MFVGHDLMVNLACFYYGWKEVGHLVTSTTGTHGNEKFSHVDIPEKEGKYIIYEIEICF